MPTTEPGHRQTTSLAGLAATLVIVVLSIVVIRKLQVRCMMETCAMSGRPGCTESVDRLRVSRLFNSG
jgi:hypothetical protein